MLAKNDLIDSAEQSQVAESHFDGVHADLGQILLSDREIISFLLVSLAVFAGDDLLANVAQMDHEIFKSFKRAYEL